MLVLAAIGALVGALVVVYRVKCLQADHEAERIWFAQEEAWWRALREGS